VQFSVEPVGYVSSTRAEAVDDAWDSESSSIFLYPRFLQEAVLGLAEFSHIEVIYCFHAVDAVTVETGARHPRGNLRWPLVGIFAQRGKSRPNRLGTTTCRLLRVDGTRLHVAGLDAIDGTPVLDIKPVMKEFLPRGPLAQPEWATELMAGYWSKDQARDA
jgi:tRNA-Thr(GGU) m(6)t(6)A37 methyltransferase TsaA